MITYLYDKINREPYIFKTVLSPGIRLKVLNWVSFERMSKIKNSQSELAEF